jgi:hypothetical protein
MFSLFDPTLFTDPEALADYLRRQRRTGGRTSVSLVSVAISVSDGMQSTVVSWTSDS